MIKWLDDRPGLAAWIQAIGSILAILTAFWIANSQANIQNAKEGKAKIEQEIIVLNAVLSYTEWIQSISIESKRDIQKKALNEFNGFHTTAQYFHERATPIQSIPVHLYGSVETMNAAFVALDASRVILEVRDTAQIPEIGSKELLKLVDLMDDMTAQVQVHIGNVRARLTALEHKK